MRWCCLLRTANGRQSSMRSIWRRDSLLHPHLTKYESLYSHSFNRFASGTTRHILHYIPRNTLSRNPASLYPRNCYDVPLGFVQINPSLPLPKLQSTPIFRQSFSYFKPQSSPPWNGGGDSGSSDRNAYRRFGEESGSKWQNTQRPRWYLYRNYFAVGTGAFGVFYVYNLETVELTGRRRFNCVSYTTEQKLGDQNYKDVLQEYQGKVLPHSHPATRMVERVMARLIPIANLPGADWKVHVIKDDNMLNAFVLPGGKVFVFTGILPICQDEDGLAAVLGHEIAHVVAHHSAERISHSFITMAGVLLIASLFDVSGQFSSVVMNLLYSLPNSRTQEAEADNIGLMIMSKACYNPSAALGIWSRMQKAEKMVPPQFLSTHPSSYNRMESIRGWLPKAEQEYEGSGCQFAGGYVRGFQDTFRSNIW